jgi:hypothetical protein
MDADAAKLEMVWHFDEGKGDACEEANGTGNDGVFAGDGKKNIKWVNGKSKKALEFSGEFGASQWVEVPHSADTDIRDAITMEAWVFPTTIDGDKRTIITKMAYYMQIEPTAQIATYFYDVTPPGYHLSDGTVNENEWSHVAVTYDGAEIKIYINGEADIVVAATGQIKTTPDVGIHIGGEKDPANEGDCCPRYFQGIIDELKISDFAKTQAEIRESMGSAKVEMNDKLATSWGKLKS